MPEPPFDFPIHTFGGYDDIRVGREHLDAWAAHTTSGFKSRYFPGDHFFINTALESVISAINSDIKSTYAEG